MFEDLRDAYCHKVTVTNSQNSPADEENSSRCTRNYGFEVTKLRLAKIGPYRAENRPLSMPEIWRSRNNFVPLQSIRGNILRAAARQSGKIERRKRNPQRGRRWGVS